MIDLNDRQEFSPVDKDGMLAHVLNLPHTCADAWELGQREYPRLGLVGGGYGQVKQIVVIGMGGSAIGGDLLAALVAGECLCPIAVYRGYDLPAHVRGPESLVIGASYSGNTEETLNAFRQAREQGALLLALTTGGEILRLSNEWGTPFLRFDYKSQPRAAVGYSLVLLVNLLCQLGLISDMGDDLVEAVETMRAWQAEIGPDVSVADNPAKRQAGLLMERLPVIYGAGLMAPVARRWKSQLNENSKIWAFYEEMPELNHNAVVGYESSEGLRERSRVIMLRSRFDSPRVQTRWRVTREMLLRQGIPCDLVEARGQSRLAHMLSLIHYGDLVSVYLALASGVDPTPVTLIAYLKEQLAKS